LWKRLVLAAIGGLVAIWIASMGAVLYWGSRDDAQNADVIVVLGAAQYVGRPSPVLRARLDHAIGLWSRDLARFLIVTGGTGPGDTTSEAAVGRQYALKHGVPDSAILVENTGRTTRESLEAVSVMMRHRNLNSAILVSDSFHMLRLSVLAQSLGFTSYTSPTSTSPISANRMQMIRYVLSESVKAPVALVAQ
jgi:uncharacterized SAM-binding protein YcdF (DUF218 family)